MVRFRGLEHPIRVCYGRNCGNIFHLWIGESLGYRHPIISALLKTNTSLSAQGLCALLVVLISSFLDRLYSTVECAFLFFFSVLTGLCCAPLSAGYTISWSGSTMASKRPFPRKSRYIIELDEDDVKINYVIRSCDTLFLSQRRDKHCMRYTLSLTYSIRLANEDRHSSMSQLIAELSK